MADFTEALTARHGAMIAAQPVVFVATAAGEGRINLSPKGYDAFRVLSPTRVAYLDPGGSGNETHAHLAADAHENGGGKRSKGAGGRCCRRIPTGAIWPAISP